MMRCPTVIDLQSYFDGELNERKKQRIRNHLRICEHCRNQVEEWEQLTGYLQGMAATLRVPVVASDSGGSIYKPKWAIAVAAVIIVCFSIPAFWYLSGMRLKNNPGGSSREAELMEEYLILHFEEAHSIGRKNV